MVERSSDGRNNKYRMVPFLLKWAGHGAIVRISASIFYYVTDSH